MYIYEFDQWCKQASKGIKYRPDKKEVHWELYHHLEDRYADFLSQGLKEEEAVAAALDAMGDAEELTSMLAAIHRPFWGYVYSLCKWLLILVIILMLLNILPYIIRQDIYELNHAFYDPFAETTHEFDAHIAHRVHYTEPNQSLSSDGYTITLTKAAEWQQTCKERDCDCIPYTGQLYILLEVTNPLPWAEHGCTANFIWAEDSLGNYYYSERERAYNYDPAIVGNCTRTGLFTYTEDLFFRNYASAGAEWIDLHYDRAGRDLVWRIDLTGGEDIP